MLKTTGQPIAEDNRTNNAEDKTTGHVLLKPLEQNTAEDNRAIHC